MQRSLRVWRFAAAVVTAGAVAACSQAGSAPPPATTADTTRIWRDFVVCARAHGQPAWPDPAVDPATGEATFSGFDAKDAFDAVREPCGHLLDGLPPQANPLARPALSPSEIAVRLQYSQCMREHGVPEFRDPGPDGYYQGGDIPGYNSDPTVTARVNAARTACNPIIGR